MTFETMDWDAEVRRLKAAFETECAFQKYTEIDHERAVSFEGLFWKERFPNIHAQVMPNW